MDPKTIYVYETPGKKAPFREWLLAMDRIVRNRIRVKIDQLSLGNPGDSKPVGSGVFELRFHFGPGYRVYYGQEGNTIVILLCGGCKDTQKQDIKMACAYWDDYKRRSKHESRP